MGKQNRLILIAVLFLAVFTAIVRGQSSVSQPNLAAQVVDPTAPIKTITFRDIYSPSIWGIDDKGNEVDFRVGIPHDAFGLPNILRVTVPYITGQPSGERGLADVELVNIFLYPSKWGTIAAGGDVLMGTNKGPGINTFALGPTLGVVLKKQKWTYGIFSQNFFSFGDIANTQLQPVLAYTFNDKFSVSYGDAQFLIDWKKSRFVNAPISTQFNFISSISKQPVQYFISPQYNLLNETGFRKWNIIGGVAFIVK